MFRQGCWQAGKLWCAVFLGVMTAGSCAKALAQSGELPAAPAPAAAKSPGLVLPPGTTTVISHSGGSPPPPDDDEECYAPAVGIYAPQPKLSAALQEQVHRYLFVAMSRVEGEWDRHMPRSANDPWLKGATVVVRFAIMPDGSTDTPLITLTSGRKDYDQHGLDAIRAATPFLPLPDGVNRPLAVCMRFGYNPDRERHRFKITDDPPERPAPAP